LKTKGDNNKNVDTWNLAGGGVVGKMFYSIPYLGYLLSFSQTKIGILLFILLPATYIILDEILKVFRLFKGIKKGPAKEIAATILMFFVSAFLFSPSYTHALLSDKVTLKNNKYTAILPSPTPSPSPQCEGNTTIVVGNNGARSNNSVIVNNSHQVVVNQSNTTTVTTNVITTTNTGNNQLSGNTGDLSITTGTSSASVLQIIQ
jgi:hypothetical protein